MATTESELTIAGTTPVTAEELLKMHAKGERGELFRGVFCPTMPAGVQHGKVAGQLHFLLATVVNSAQSGTLLINGPGVILGRNPDTVRAPDIAYYSAEKMPLDADVPGYTEIIPDLVVEVVSPSDGPYETSDKAHMWIACGVRLAWVVYPVTKSVQVIQPGGLAAALGEDSTLDGDDVLPAFSCRVGDIFQLLARATVSRAAGALAP